MASISNLEVFGVGTHRAMTGQVTITEQDLDNMVSAFNELTNVIKPHLKLGHTEAQKWFGQKDGIPSLGWIEKVWRVGGKLLANIKDVPEALISLLRQGRYHNVSAEVYFDMEHEDKKYPRVLSAISLLGVEMPAVKDLAGLAEALFQAGPIHQFSGDAPTELVKEELNMFTQEQVDSLVAAAVANATDDVKEEFSTRVADLDKQVEVLTIARDAALVNLDVVKAEAANKEATTLVDDAIKGGRLLPKQRDFALAALTAQDTKMKFGKDEKPMSAMFKEFLDAQGTVIDTSEKGSGKNKKVEFSNASEEIDHKAKEFMAGDSKLGYADAFDRVLASDDDLRSRYADMSN